MPRRLHADKMIPNSNALCRCVQEQMPALIDGTVPQQKRSAIERHLASCTDCSTACADYQRMEQLLGAARFALPAAGDLLPGFTARLESSGVGPANRTPSKRRRISYALAAPAFAIGAAAVAFVFGTSIAPRPGSSMRHNSSSSTEIASRPNGKPDTRQATGGTRTPPEIAAGLMDGHHGNVPLSITSAEPSSRPVRTSPEAAGRGGNSIGALPYQQTAQETARVSQQSSLSRYSKGFAAFADGFAYGLSAPPDADWRVALLSAGDKVWGRFKSTSNDRKTYSGLPPMALNEQQARTRIALGDKRNAAESLSSNSLMMDTNAVRERETNNLKRNETNKAIATAGIDRNATSFALGLASASQPEMYYYQSDNSSQESATTLVVQDDARGFTSVVQTVRKPDDTNDQNALRIEEDTESEPGVKPGAGTGH